MRHVLPVALFLSLAGIPVSAASAQIRASELQTISQVVDGTKVTVEYSRPRLRGRTEIFGTRAAHWDEVWTPGANWATTLQTSAPIEIEGVRVPTGKFGVWMIITKDSVWTMLLDPEWQQFHMAHPEPAARHLKIPVHANAKAMPLQDVLTWSFPAVTARGATMAMHWADTRVTMNYTVTPTLSELLAEAEASKYVGRYAIETPRQDLPVKPMLVVTYARGGLKARFEPEDPYMQTFALMRVAPDIFTAGLFMSAEVYANDEIYEVLRPEFMLTFMEIDGAPGLEVRGADDSLDFRARLVKPAPSARALR